MITGFHHVQITIDPADEPAARLFYCDVLGLTEIGKPDSLRERGGFWVQVGARQLHIGVEKDVDRSSTKAHVAYEVDDLETWRERLAAAGIIVLDGVPIPGFYRFECRDPFGNRIEFIQPL